MKLPSMRFNTLAGTGLVGALAGVGGSVITILLVVSMVWALVSLALRRFPPTYQRSDLAVIIPAFAYVAVMLLASWKGWAPGGPADRYLTDRAIALLPFLFFPLVLPRLRTVPAAALLDSFVRGSAFCGLLALPVAVVQVEYFGIRAEGGAGNPLPFAMVCAVFGSVSLLNATMPSARRQALGWAGFLSACICILLSQSRGILPVPLIALAAMALFFPRQRRSLYNVKSLLVLVAGMAAVALVAAEHFARFQSLIGYMLGKGGVGGDQSYSLRLQMWDHASRLIGEQPWLGYGMQNRDILMAETGLKFTHFHNGFITVLVDAGVLGLVVLLLLLASPLISVWKNPSSVGRRKRLFLAIVIVSTCLVGGLTNVIFFHDIYDSVFLWTVLIVAAPLSMGYRIASPAVAEVRSHGA